MIVKIQDQWYDIPKHQPTPIIEMDLAKKAKNLIKHAQKLMLLMVKPQHSQNITATTDLSTMTIDNKNKLIKYLNNTKMCLKIQLEYHYIARKNTPLILFLVLHYPMHVFIEGLF